MGAWHGMAEREETGQNAKLNSTENINEISHKGIIYSIESVWQTKQDETTAVALATQPRKSTTMSWTDSSPAAQRAQTRVAERVVAVQTASIEAGIIRNSKASKCTTQRNATQPKLASTQAVLQEGRREGW